MTLKNILTVAGAVREALGAGKPVVALESTVITHGLPYPENIQTARRLESVVREEGAVPATIAILNGRAIIGISDEELEQLGTAKDAEKLNPSNLASGIVSGKPGSTTVAATMLLAAKAGIQVFATGGIGGVHRGVKESWDISADLIALSTYPIAVVSAGAKAILDLPKTVEQLETLGVPIYGWRTDEFPSFYRRHSGLRVDARYEEMELLAQSIATHWELGLRTGVLVANPVPEDKQLDKEVYLSALKQSLGELKESGICGRKVTPFLLEAMRKATDGQSVFTNTALLENNVRVAARLADLLTYG
jgi:pseudouridylate synthase